MPNRTVRALQRTFSPLLALLFPATGARRLGRPLSPVGGRPATGHRPQAPQPPQTASGLRLLVRALTPPRLPAGRQPYLNSPHAAPTWHRTAPLIRPYYVTHEQRERRTALALALDGIDVGPWVIHGHRIGTPAPAATPIRQAVAA
ncbi:hypothetical protein [Streptomyces orinoci]|uniref:Uncharacterized protein n=1 Tax=Streptomyces orinoci TaxID=67339 RepID=A0ABV3K1D7_STRON|nr:hypothetical protein [Streptomyces orinoci]